MGVVQPMWLREEEVPLLPDGWTAMQTADATVQLSPGKLFDKRTVTEKGAVPVLNQGESGFIGYHNEEPGVAASADRPVVTFANHTCAMRLMKQPFSCIQNIFPKVGRDGVCDTLYFYYAAQGRVSLTDYKGHHPLFRQSFIPVPPLPTQRKIAAILSAYDDLIENNRRRIEILEEMAQALYREWFVEFRFPGHEAVRMVDSPLGKIPEGWEAARLGDLIDIRKGKNITRKEIVPGPVPVVAAGLEPAYYHDTANTLHPVVTVSASGANAGYVCLYHEDVWASDCSVIDSTTTPHVYFYYLLLKERQTEVTRLQRGSAQPHVYPVDLMGLDALEVPVATLASFHEQTAPLFHLIRNLTLKSSVLRCSRDLLLPRLISGELDVSDLDIDVGEEGA